MQLATSRSLWTPTNVLASLARNAELAEEVRAKDRGRAEAERLVSSEKLHLQALAEAERVGKTAAQEAAAETYLQLKRLRDQTDNARDARQQVQRLMAALELDNTGKGATAGRAEIVMPGSRLEQIAERAKGMSDTDVAQALGIHDVEVAGSLARHSLVQTPNQR